MDRLERALTAPLMIISQLTATSFGLIFLLLPVALIVWTVIRRPAWGAVWPALLTPLPWLALAVWAGWHWRETGPQTGFHAEAWGLLMLAVTLALSVWAVVRAKRVRWPVAGLCLVNFAFAMIAALFASMMTTGAWL